LTGVDWEERKYDDYEVDEGVIHEEGKNIFTCVDIDWSRLGRREI